MSCEVIAEYLGGAHLLRSNEDSIILISPSGSYSNDKNIHSVLCCEPLEGLHSSYQFPFLSDRCHGSRHLLLGMSATTSQVQLYTPLALPLTSAIKSVFPTQVEACHDVQKQRQQVEDATPQMSPVNNKASRFGKPAFRIFYDEAEKVGH